MEEFIFDLQRFAFPDDLSTDESGNYLISSPAELQALATYVNAKNECAGLTFKLTADIDMSIVENFTPIGTPDRDDEGYLSTKPFKGTFDGDGHTISNLKISGEDYVGLFGQVEDGTIKNVNLNNVNINGNACVGGIASSIINGGSVDNCTVSGSVTGTKDGSYNIGGIVGYIEGGSVDNCTVSGSVTGGDYVGGIVGCINGGSVDNCTVSGSVTGKKDDSSEIGGIAGYSNVTVSNSTNTGDVTGGNSVGGLVGTNNGGNISDSKNSGSVTGKKDDSSEIGGIAGYSNVIVSNSTNTGNVTGGENVGGIVGYTTSCILTKCVNISTISGNKTVGILAGFYYSTFNGSGYYYLTEGNESLPVLGYGNTPETVKRVYILDLPEDVTATGNDVIKVDDVYYCAENSEVSLTSEEPLEVDGQKLSKNADGTYAFTMSAANVEVEISSSDDTDIKYNKAKTSATVTSVFKGHTLTADDYDSDVEKINASKVSKSFTIYGNDNSIKGGSGRNTIDGGRGDDTLYGGKSNDLFVWSAGDDLITDYAEDDKISLDGAGKKISIVDANGKTDTRIYLRHMTFDGDQTQVMLDSSFSGAFDASDYKNLETIDATATESYGVKLFGNDNDNLILGGKRSDILSGGDGDDTLTGGAGNDKFVWSAGDDEITDYAEGDKISVDGAIELENVSVSGKNVEIKLDGGSLTIDNALGKKISVSDDNGSHNYIFDTTAVYNAEKTSASLLSATRSFVAPDNVKVIDGSLTKKAELVGNGLGNSIIGGAGNDTLWGMAGNDSLYGGDGNDVFIYMQGDGNDTVFDYANNDMIFIFGDTQPINKFVGRNLVISTGTGSITLKDFVGSGSTNVNMLFVKTS